MYNPIASLDSYHAPIVFVVPAQTEYYTDLSQSNLYLKFRILKEDGTNLDDDQKFLAQYVQWHRSVSKQ